MNTVVIIGYGQGFGKSLVTKFLSQEARVIVCGTNPERLNTIANEFKNKVSTVCMDVTDNMSILTASAEIDSVDVLIYNAVRRDAVNVLGINVIELQKDLDVSLLGAVRVIQTILPKMNNNGTIIFTNGGAAYNPTQNNVIMSISKASLLNYGKSLSDAFETNQNKIKVGIITIEDIVSNDNGIAPELVSEQFRKITTYPNGTEIRISAKRVEVIQKNLK